MKQLFVFPAIMLLFLSLGAASPAEDSAMPFLDGVKQRFPGFKELEKTAPFTYSIRGENGRLLGRLLQETAGDADRKTGYAGTIPVALCLGTDGRITGVLSGPNQETPRYIRMLEKKKFFERWNGMTLEEAAERQVDAVTRATYSSDAIIHGVRRLAQGHLELSREKSSSGTGIWNGFLLAAAILLGAAICLLCEFQRRFKRKMQRCDCCRN